MKACFSSLARQGGRDIAAHTLFIVLCCGMCVLSYGGAFVYAQGTGTTECSDGVDNNGNGDVDALVNGGDPAATQSFGGGNPFVVLRIVNGAADDFGYGTIPDGAALHNDAATALKVCTISGYLEVDSFDCAAPPYGNRCGYADFTGHQMYTWNGTSFVTINDNSWLSTVTCKKSAAACGDGKDNDGDGRIDMVDNGCVTVEDASEVRHDGLCANSEDDIEGQPKCKDSADNDGDGFEDFPEDPGCADSDDNDESDDPVQDCPEAYPLCGNGATATCPEGKSVSWSGAGARCDAASGRCYVCTPDDDGGGDDDLQCPATCQVDDDCPGVMKCTMSPRDASKPACWFDTASNACVKRCTVPRCINNICGRGPAVGTPTAPFFPCDATACPAASCGDGILQASGGPTDEQCDDGNLHANDGCGPTCKKEICGDGIMQPNGADALPNTADDETCDDGNLNVADGCDNECALETCGNSVVDYGEWCDDGPLNSDTVPGACRTNCMAPACGDGVVDAMEPWGEECECDDDNVFFDEETGRETCDVDVDTGVGTVKGFCQSCQLEYCGDGVAYGPGADRTGGTIDDEMCDEGPRNSDFPTGSGLCSVNSQCPGGVCVDGECDTDVMCNANSECYGGKCVNGRCRPGGCSGLATQLGECGEGKICRSGACVVAALSTGFRQHCTEDLDCPSGACSPYGVCLPAAEPGTRSNCRMDCKPVRCGDEIIDEEIGETCDEGSAMMKCIAYPQPSCDCAIPSLASMSNPGGGTFSYTCCSPPDGNNTCEIQTTDTCPEDCGILPVCGNGLIEGGEECEESPSTTRSSTVFRPNRDGTHTSFMADDGRWDVLPLSVGDKYLAIDHAPARQSPDRSYILSAPSGVSFTYFHLWDTTMSEDIANRITVKIGVDFFGTGTGWDLLKTNLAPISPSHIITLADLNEAVISVKGDATAHTVSFALYETRTGRQLTATGTIASPTRISTPEAIAIDALQLVVEGGSPSGGTCVDCLLIRCGNFRLETTNGEQCDDGNAESDDGCTSQCKLEMCMMPET